MFAQLTDLPRLLDFNDAVEFYTNTNGIRGRENVIPLKRSRRSPDAYRISAVKDVEGNICSIECWLYRTPVLTYTPERLIIEGYCSQTTNAFINEIAPFWLGVRMQDSQQVFCVGSEGLFLSDIHGRLEIPVDANYTPIKGEVKAAQLLEVVLNRTRAAEARKECKSLIALATMTAKIDGYWEALVKSTDIAPDEETAWLKGVLKMGGYRIVDRYTFMDGTGGNRPHHYLFGQADLSATPLLQRLKSHVYNAQYNEQRCYDKTPAPYGVIPNRYEVTK